MRIKFQKWHGCQNDFIIVDLPNDPFLAEALTNTAQNLCSRTGSAIGADGLLLVERFQKDSHPKLTIINSDGSQAATCGNGIRCAAVYINEELNNDSVVISLKSGEDILCRFSSTNPSFVTVEMGVPQNLPLPKNQSWQDVTSLHHDQLDISRATSWDILNQHLVIPIRDSMETNLPSVAGMIGPKLQVDDGINVHLFREKGCSKQDMDQAQNDIGDSISELIEVCPYERGAGLTRACGSGACAVAAHTFSDGFADRNMQLAIDMPGGRLYVSQREPGGVISLTGPAIRSFWGELSI